MKTDDLIKAMVADTATTAPPIQRTLWLALISGAALAALHFMSVLNIRSDFAYAITSEPRFIFKFVFTLALAIAAAVLVQRLARPEGKIGWAKWLLFLPVAMLAAAVALEMQAVPPEHWSVSAIGSMPGACMKYIPLLSIAPFVAIMLGLRAGAPSRPWAAGAAAGLMAAVIGAALYATFCVDDSPMFLAIWYVTGIAIVVVAGAIIGSRVLRW